MGTLDEQFELFNVAHVSGCGLGRCEKIKTALPSTDGLRRKGAQSGNRFFSQRSSRTLRLCVKPVFPRGIISHLLGRGNGSGFGTARLVDIPGRGRKLKNSRYRTPRAFRGLRLFSWEHGKSRGPAKEAGPRYLLNPCEVKARRVTIARPPSASGRLA